MSILELAKKETVAFIVYAPPKELLVRDPIKVERTLRGLESGVDHNMIPFVENPQRIFVDGQNLTTEEKQLRQENLETLDKGFFELLILAGASLSEYVRQIITSACRSDMDISLYADEDSLLTRYLHMQQSGRV